MLYATVRSMLTFLGASLVAASATAGMVVTYEAPGIQTSQISTQGGDTLDVVTFDGLSSGVSFVNPIGIGGLQTVTYLANGSGNPNILPADQYGGAGGTGSYLRATNGSPATAILSVDQTYFGMWWSAGDGANVLEFYNNNVLVGTFTTQDVLNTGLTPGTITDPTPGHFGNPNASFQGQNSSQPYAFLNFYFTDSTAYDEIRFLSGTFESDNHTFAQSFIGPPFSGTPVVPEPTTLASLGLVGLAIGWRAVRRRRQDRARAAVQR